jgi:hypothetical protein
VSANGTAYEGTGWPETIRCFLKVWVKQTTNVVSTALGRSRRLDARE